VEGSGLGITIVRRSSPTRNADLTLGANHTDPDRLALAFWILQPRLLCVFLLLEGLRQRPKLSTDVPEEQPPLNDSGHLKLIAQAAPTSGRQSQARRLSTVNPLVVLEGQSRLARI